MTTATPTLGAAVRSWTRTSPDAVAVRCGDDLTHRELDERTDAIAAAWIADGVHVDDLVGVELPNGLDAVLAPVAAWKAGATPLPLSPDLDPGERQAVLDLARPVLVVSGPLPAHRYPPAHDPLPDLAASSWKAPTSSGSTGRPEVVRAATPARFDPRARVAPFVPRRAVQLVAGPLWHAAPFTYALRGLVTGHELVLLPRFDAGAWLRAVARHRVTWRVLAPSMMLAVWRHPDRAGTDVSSLAAVLHLGARCAPWLKRAWIGWLGPQRVHELYAGTESQGLAFTDGAGWLRRPGTVGRPLPGSEFRVVRPGPTELVDCATGELGEVLMRRGTPTYSYLDATARVRDGWHTLGDTGWLDEEGFLFIADRLEDLIRTGGSTVVPADVETVLEEHPSVRSAVVVGLPDDDLGERVHAVVDATADLTTAELDSWCARRLDPPQRPVSWSFADGPLRAQTGKVRRGRWRTAGPAGRRTGDDYDR